MTATKPSRTGALIGAILLVGSVALNLQLWRRSTLARQERDAASASLASTSKAQKTGPLTAGLTSLDFVKDADLPTLRDALYAAGASETRARQIIFGILRRRWREAQTNKRLARIERGWWKDESRTLGISRNSRWIGDDNILLKELVVDKMEELLGVDPAQAGVVNARYSYLPEETRLQLARLERERQLPAEWVPTGDREVDAKAEAEWGRFLEAHEAEKEKLLASLTPEQRREHDMRYGQLGTRLAFDYRNVPGGTEEEFRKLYGIAEEFAGGNAGGVKIPTASGMGMVVLAGTGASAAEAAEAGRRATERVIAELGYDRALEYLWSGSSEYRAVAAMSQQTGLPPTTAVRFTQLASETGTKAAAIHKDETLNGEQRRAMLLALQQSARAEVDALLPPDTQQKLPVTAMTWLNQMSAGQYRLISPGIPGRGSGTTVVNITANAPNLPSSSPLPPRPAGN